MSENRVGIVVGGGPAPGINGVIGSATIEAVNQGFEVVGFFDGFRWLTGDAFDEPTHAIPLSIRDVARIHFDGGSVLRTSRANLIDPSTISDTDPVQPDRTKTERVLSHFKRMNITHLITIGGDDTALSSRFIADAADGAMRVVHVPKTIDNDLPLPHGTPSFGYATARFYGTQIIKNLMRDSLTTGRWYIVTVMGRRAGALALGVGQAAGATVTVIPEEFTEKTTLHAIADVVEGAMLKRLTMGRPDGVAVVAEGLAYQLGDRKEIEQLLGREVRVDAAGHLRLSDIPLGQLVRAELELRFKARGERLNMVTHLLGYELRSADPTPGDMAYCRSLGHGCIRLLTMSDDTRHGAMVTLINGNLYPLKFQEMVDPRTNRIRIRRVDVTSDFYRVARAYMLRLERGDLEDAEMLKKLSAVAKMTPEAFRERYRAAATRIVDGVPVQ